MSPHRRLPRALNGRLLAELAKRAGGARTQGFDWREFRNRGRAKVSWNALIVSGAGHLAVFFALSVSILTTVDMSEVSTLLAEMAPEPEEVALVTFDSGLDPAPQSPSEAAASTPVELPDLLDRHPPADPDLAELDLTGLIKDIRPDLPTGDELMRRPPERASDQQRKISSGKPGGDGAQRRTAKYFGTVARGERFVYVLDMSSSMSGNRFDRAVRELLRSLQELKPDQSFYVVLFSNGMRRMFDEQGPGPQMLPATPDNKRRLEKWITSVSPSGGTEPRKAVRFAFSLKPSAIFVLSDGAFDGFNGPGRGDVFHTDPRAAELLGKENLGQAPIHSFAFEDPQAKGNMQALASLTGGRYRFIAAGAAGRPSPQPQPQPKPQPKPQPRPQPQPAATASQRPVAVPLPPRALLAKGDQFRAAGQYDRALWVYRELVRRYPMTSVGATARGRIIQVTRQAWRRR